LLFRVDLAGSVRVRHTARSGANQVQTDRTSRARTGCHDQPVAKRENAGHPTARHEPGRHEMGRRGLL